MQGKALRAEAGAAAGALQGLAKLVSEGGGYIKQIFSVEENSLKLEKDGILDFYSQRGEVNAWFQSFTGVIQN